MLLYDRKNDKYIFACDPDKLRDLILRLVFYKEDIHSPFVYPFLVSLAYELRRGTNYNNFEVMEDLKNESSGSSR